MRDIVTSNNSQVAGIVQFEPATQVIKFDEFKIARKKAMLNRDFDEFLKTKRYVLENLEYMRGRVVPMEVTGIQSLPTHDCVILNDLLLYSYTEMEEIIKAAKEADKKLGRTVDIEPEQGA